MSVPPGCVRLQKLLSDAGVASRRRAEELILEGRVLVNDQIVETLPAFADPQRDRIIVDGAVVRPQRRDYFIVHKPKGVICTHRDPAGRLRAVDLLPDLPARLFPVGRLDTETSGLLLMTNDGELAQRLAHPRFGIAKVYRAEVRGRVPDDLPAQLRRGVYFAEGRASADEVEIVYAGAEQSVLEITLRESRNREVRRILARLGYPVKKLKRVQLGPLSLRGLPEGAARRLAPNEVAALRVASDATATAGPQRGRRGRAGGGRLKRTGRAAGRTRGGERPASPGRRLIT